MQRDLGTFRSIRVNNFFFFIALLVYSALQSGLPPWSALPFIILMAVPLLFPLSSDPLDKIPAERLGIWPLGHRRKLALRVISLALSPIFWLILLLILKKSNIAVALAFILIAVAARGVASFGKYVPELNGLRWMPLLPGRLGGVITNHIREMLSVLDTWVAILLATVSLAYRFAGALSDHAALPILSMLIALALSTPAQSLFGLDFDFGVMLYRLLPLRGWEVLLAKDIAFLALLMVLTVALDPLAGLTFGVASLGIGHHSSVRMRLPQRRWRFAGGKLLPAGALQVLASIFLGVAEMRRGSLVLGLTSAGYLLSLWFYGRRLPDMPGD